VRRLAEMNKAEKRELALKLKELCEHEHWSVIEQIEFEMYERAKSQMVSNGYLFAIENNEPIRKTADQYAMEQAASRGALDFMNAMKVFRENILDSLTPKEND